MNVFRVFGLTLLIALTGTVSAQDSTVHEITPAVITPPRGNDYGIGSKVETMPSDIIGIYQNSNLSDLLTSQSTIFVKSYGSGGIATTSFRGTAAEHTAVMWNGFNVLNPMLGLFDFSLVPSMFIDEMSIQYGSATALFGSGAIGGVIHLRSVPEYGIGTKTSLGSTVGSFGVFRQSGSYTYSSDKFISKTKLFNYSADNNYSYVNTEKLGSPTEKLAHAKVNQQGLTQDNYFKLKNKQQIGVHYWYQTKTAEIPPTLTQTDNTSVQYDDFNRLSVDWVKETKKTTWQARTGYFNDWIRFEDAIGISSANHFVSSISEVEANHYFTKIASLNAGLNNTLIHASSISDGKAVLGGIPKRSQQALFVSYKQKLANKRVLLNASSRAELIDGDLKPITPSLAIEYKPRKHQLYRLKGGRNYRIPTLNNLYWQGSGAEGNPDLRPELGWSYETGFNTKLVRKNLVGTLDLAGFSSKIDDWMLWTLDPDNKWRPHNIRQVFSRGVEVSASVTYKLADSSFIKLNGKYTFVKSTVEKSELGGQDLIGKQLIYTPTESGLLNISYIRKTLLFNINSTHTGWRFISSDNEEKMSPYILINLALSKSFKLGRHALALSARANNIMGVKYEALRYRPMPQNNYELGLNITFNKKLE